MAYSVAIYLVDRAYGGSEEGGWYYDCGEPDHDHARYTRLFAAEGDAHKYMRDLQSRICADLNDGRPSISSVLSIGRYRACINEGLPAPFPERRPHYE